jgi:hypothetical protein
MVTDGFLCQKNKHFLTQKNKKVMKRNATINGAGKAGKLSIPKGIILFIIVMLLPGCMANVSKCEIIARNYCMAAVITSPFIGNSGNNEAGEINYSVIAGMGAQALTDATKAGKIPMANIITAIPASDGQNLATHTIPPTLIDTDHHFDPHDNNEEENILTVSLPRLMRVALMLMLLVFIV